MKYRYAKRTDGWNQFNPVGFNPRIQAQCLSEDGILISSVWDDLYREGETAISHLHLINDNVLVGDYVRVVLQERGEEFDGRSLTLSCEPLPTLWKVSLIIPRGDWNNEAKDYRDVVLTPTLRDSKIGRVEFLAYGEVA